MTTREELSYSHVSVIQIFVVPQNLVFNYKTHKEQQKCVKYNNNNNDNNNKLILH
jgi:hypothetical protein